MSSNYTLISIDTYRLSTKIQDSKDNHQTCDMLNCVTLSNDKWQWQRRLVEGFH